MGGCVSLCEKLELFPKKKKEAERHSEGYLDGSFKKKKKKGMLREELIQDEDRERKESISIELQSRRLMEEKEREIEEYNKEQEEIQQQIGPVTSVKQLTRYSRKREAQQQQQQYQQQIKERDSTRVKKEEKEIINKLVSVEETQGQSLNQQISKQQDNLKDSSNNQIIKDKYQEIEGRKAEEYGFDERQNNQTDKQQGFSLLKLQQVTMKKDTFGLEELKVKKDDSKEIEVKQTVVQQEKVDNQSTIQTSLDKNIQSKINEISKEIENSSILSKKVEDNLPSELLGGIAIQDDQKLSINEKVKEIMSNSEQEELLTCANTEQRNTAKGSEEEETNEEIAVCHLSRNLDDDDEDDNNEEKIKAKEEKIKEIRQSLQQQLHVVKPNNNNIVYFPHASFSPHTRAHLHQPLSQPSLVQPNSSNNTNHSHKEQILFQQISSIGNPLSASQNQNNFADETDFSLLLNNDSQKNSFIYGNFHQNNIFKDSKFILDESIIHPVRDIVNNGEDSDTSSKKEEWISDQLRKQQSTQDLVSLLQPARTSLELINKFERQQSKDNNNYNISENMYFPKQKAESEKVRHDSIESISYSEKRASPINTNNSISQTPKTRYEEGVVRTQEERIVRTQEERLSPQKMMNNGKSRGGSQDDLLPVKEEDDSHNIHGKAEEFSFCFDDTSRNHDDLEVDKQQQFNKNDDDDHKLFTEMERQQEEIKDYHLGQKDGQSKFSEIGKSLKKTVFERKDRKRCFSEQEATEKGSERLLPLPDFGGCPNRDGGDKQVQQIQEEKIDVEDKKKMEIEDKVNSKDENNNNNNNNNNNKDSLLSALQKISKQIQSQQIDVNNQVKNNNEECASTTVDKNYGEEEKEKQVEGNQIPEGFNTIIIQNTTDLTNQNKNTSSINTDNLSQNCNQNTESTQIQPIDPSSDLLNFISPSNTQNSENSSKNNNNAQEIISNVTDKTEDHQNDYSSPDTHNNISIVIQDPKNNTTEQLIYTIHPLNSKISLQKPSIKGMSSEISGNDKTKDQQKSINDPTKTILFNNSNKSLLENTNRIVMQKRVRNPTNSFNAKKSESMKQLRNLITEGEKIKDDLEKHDSKDISESNEEEEEKQDNNTFNGSKQGNASSNFKKVESTLEQNSRLIEDDWKQIKGNTSLIDNNNHSSLFYSCLQDRNIDDQSISNQRNSMFSDKNNLNSPNNSHKAQNPLINSSGTLIEETKTPDDFNTSDSKQICKSDSFKSFRDDTSSNGLNNSQNNISPNRMGRSASVNYFRPGVVSVKTSADQSPFESCFNTPSMSMRGSLKVIQHDLYQRRSISNVQQVSYFKKSSVMSQQYFDCDSYELQVINGDTLLNRDLVEHPETYMEWIQTLPVIFEIPAVLSSEALYQFELIKQETYQDFVVKLQSENEENFDLFDVIIDGSNRTIFFRSELGLDQQRIFIVIGEYYVKTRSYSQFYNFKNSFDSQHKLNGFDTLTPLNDDLQNTILVGVSTHHLLPKPCEVLFLKHFSFLQQNNNNAEDNDGNNISSPPLEQMCEIDISLNSEEIEQHLKANKKQLPQTQQSRGEIFSGNITTAIPNENQIKVEILFEHNFHNAMTVQQARNMYTEMFTAFFAKLDATFP